MKKILQIYIGARFYWSLLLVTLLFVLGYYFPVCLALAKLSALLCVSAFLLEAALLIIGGEMLAQRNMSAKFSNGDMNPVKLKLQNRYPFRVAVELIDEVPVQFQKRDFKVKKLLAPGEEWAYTYQLKPVQRGVYEFGYCMVFVKSLLGYCQVRYKLAENENVAVYPSFYQLRKTELIAAAVLKSQQGHKALRRAGNNREFEQIKEYVAGDDIRRMNWKATARHNKLMVNQYEDEKAQNVYQVIDMGRTMMMPFEGLSLLDYSINCSLAISNVVLKRHDKIGLLTYSDRLHSFIQPDKRANQLVLLSENLYAQQTDFKESNLEAVFVNLQRRSQGRSLIILYTNFESAQNLERQLPLLRQLALQHLVLLVSFINSEVLNLSMEKADSTEDVYMKAIAEKSLMDKQALLKSLHHYGIMTLQTEPKDLNIEVLNKYLEIKSRGLL